MQKIFGISVVALLLVSCNQSGGVRSVNTTPPPITTTIPSTPAVTTDSATPVITSQPTLPMLPGANNNVSTVALNPKHGEPGHRCDIPVGTPLSAPPVNTVQPTVTNSNPAPVMMNTQPATQPAALPSNKALTLNPAHGLPGHDCTIPVGQPLKS